jgi:hypothetical protein
MRIRSLAGTNIALYQWRRRFLSDKGKPVVRLGRKVTGPKRVGTAGLPKKGRATPALSRKAIFLKGAVVMCSVQSKSRLNVLPLLLLQVAFALALVFTGVVGAHAEAASRLPDLIVSAVI